MRISAPCLFFLYAHPCGEVLVRKGKMTGAQLDSIRRSLLHRKLPRQPPALFRTAMKQLQLTAAAMRHKSIGSAVIRQYFWHGHDRLAGNDCRCRIMPAKVVEAAGGCAAVSTPAGVRNVNILLAGKVKPGDLLTVHYDYACEKISRQDFARLWRMKR